MQVIPLNGPPGCGKDTLARLLVQAHDDAGVRASHCEFKEAVRQAVADFYHLTETEYAEFVFRANSRELKEVPWGVIDGRSPRGALIHVSENVMKPIYGQDVFGRALKGKIDKLAAQGVKRVFISDSGFIDELRPIANVYPTLVIALHGRGTFEGDSRRYLEPVSVLSCAYGSHRKVVLQEGAIDAALQECARLIAEWGG